MVYSPRTLLLFALLSLARGLSPHGQACLTPATSALPFCNPALPLESRLSDLISRLTLAEKIGLSGTMPNTDMCAGVDAGVPRLDIPALSNLIECTGAVSSSCFNATDGTVYCPTVFPAPLSIAASFNRSLMRLRGAVTGIEARAFNNLQVNRIYGNPVDLLAFGPDLNLIVDPRNGRNGENPSEDGFLAGAYATEYVRGAQQSEADPAHLQLAMSLKHFAGYQEETNRFASNFSFSMFDLIDTYLVPFAAGFRKLGMFYFSYAARAAHRHLSSTLSIISQHPDPNRRQCSGINVQLQFSQWSVRLRRPLAAHRHGKGVLGAPRHRHHVGLRGNRGSVRGQAHCSLLCGCHRAVH